ncbi:Shikimate kinase 1 [Botrimarina colliarenosi]|uniref:Shikimate kinase n=1 Tax=Botrimarina colliarenosi TaxID=2528001 RepID=A0A5C6AIA0_9BACT|nr:shikimate kinase [Botrimarina colliarenosi]TWT99772.1 Shikimate kinase 1 [Botrimarina colliarenosi]
MSAAQPKTNVVLIGMPGSGKSTVGVLLAKHLSRGFVDTDLIIQTNHGKTLQQIVDGAGHAALLDAEEAAVRSLDVENHVVATGGSVVYSAAGMAHLKAIGVLVYLATDLATLEARVGDYTMRGLAKRPEQTLADLFAERQALYEQYADVTVETAGLSHDAVCARVEAALDR